jgi:hypothetical protein
MVTQPTEYQSHQDIPFLAEVIADESKKSEAWINHASLLVLAALRALETSYVRCEG